MSAKLIIKEIQNLVDSCSVNTNGVVLTVTKPDSFVYSWRLSNKENIGSSYHCKIDNLQVAEDVIKHFFEVEVDTLANLKKHSQFTDKEDLYLHLYLNIQLES